MDLLVIICLLWAAAYALKRGAQTASRDLMAAYHGRLGALGVQAPAKGSKGGRGGRGGRSTPVKAASAGVKVGAAVATGLTGAALTGRGFVAGVKQGWPEGKQKGQDWWEKRGTGKSPEPTEVEPATAEPYQPSPAYQNVLDQVETKHGPTEAARWRGEVEEIHARGEIPTTTGGGGMAIMTNTGGEVLSMQQLIGELEGIKKEAAADMEDAHADKQRAEEDAKRIELMLSSLQRLDLDSQTLQEVGALRETAGQRKAAAEQRASAADARMSQASAALQGVQQRHGQLQEAHMATPHAAERGFYTKG